MSDDQNTTQNPIPEETSLPPSPQEPTEQAPEITPVSQPADVPSRAPEALQGNFNAESTNSAINKGDAETALHESEPKSPETLVSPSAESENSEADKPTDPL
jgi:hypothetical protein